MQGMIGQISTLHQLRYNPKFNSKFSSSQLCKRLPCSNKLCKHLSSINKLQTFWMMSLVIQFLLNKRHRHQIY